MDTIHKLIAKIDEQASKNTPATHKQIEELERIIELENK